MPPNPADLVAQALTGNRLALARLLTLVESQTDSAIEALNLIFPATGNAHRVGITGAPGTGKSSLTNKLAQTIRRRGETAAILAVDPSSPFTGGAILGDRIRMRECAGDPGIFIRSMASRGALGGLSLTTNAAAEVLDGVGFDWILVETVGTGQAEVEIASLAHTVIVVEAPGLGDEIQAIKAGILEIADLILVNKTDQPGALRTESALMAAFHAAERPAYRHHSDIDQSGIIPPTSKDGWSIPILRTNAIDGEGVDAVLARVLEHRTFLQESGQWQAKETQRMQHAFEQSLRHALYTAWHDALPGDAYDDLLRQLNNRAISPQQLARQTVQAWLTGSKSESNRHIS
jgi:LAO/AO transport system kinase